MEEDSSKTSSLSSNQASATCVEQSGDSPIFYSAGLRVPDTILSPSRLDTSEIFPSINDTLQNPPVPLHANQIAVVMFVGTLKYSYSDVDLCHISRSKIFYNQLVNLKNNIKVNSEEDQGQFLSVNTPCLIQASKAGLRVTIYGSNRNAFYPLRCVYHANILCGDPAFMALFVRGNKRSERRHEIQHSAKGERLFSSLFGCTH
ncbi:unnamed protein product [Protopolystoma xenopodis]|uniref:Uncharacterized protein n=1 Tax=Protopolystoma xenopodis TaxID=117903 RepID=A0A448WHE9_9PLAT|nr:unnamed protein product [Protopolystoma xenopodis]